MKPFYQLFALAFLSLGLTGCSMENLSIHTEYINKEHLASYHIDTPDPLLLNPPIGQRLVIQWNILRKYRCYDESYLILRIRFRNRQEEIKKIPIDLMIGFYCYDLLNEDFIKKKGILTYKVDLIRDGLTIETWQHQLWVELIELTPLPESNE